jgi:hypothetical protein
MNELDECIGLAARLIDCWSHEELSSFAFDRLVNELQECTSGELDVYKRSLRRMEEELQEARYE